MFAHYRLLATVLAAAAFFGSGAYLGYQYCDGHHAKEAARAQEQAIETLREQLEVEKRDAVERAKREALAAARSQAARSKGVNDATLKAKPSCDRDGESYRLLIDAINTANSQASAGGLPNRMPTDSDTGFGLRPVIKGLGVRLD